MVSNQNFLHKLYAGNTTANQRIKYHKLQRYNLSLKVEKKNPEKSQAFFKL